MHLHDKNCQEENRLIILYLYNKMFMPLKDAFVEEFFYDREWMTYFDMKAQLLNLFDEGYLEPHEKHEKNQLKGAVCAGQF